MQLESEFVQLWLCSTGGQHGDGDTARDAMIAGEGYRVLRFWNHDVLGNPDGVARAIAEALGEGGLRSSRRGSPPSNSA